ncbi:MAG TPA: glycosyltransferase [Thermoleophilaceae bacterium]|nr:glycosyltransferase [Thermoleophilaceae bacterium]
MSLARRLLIVLPAFAGNGVTRYVLDLANELTGLDCSVTLFSIRPVDLGEIPHDVSLSVPVISGGVYASRRYLYRWPIAAARLVRAARRSDMVVAAWDTGYPLLGALLAGRVARRPVIAQVASYPTADFGEYLGAREAKATLWCYPRLDKAVCAADGLIDEVQSMGVAHDRAITIAWGIDVERTQALGAEEPPEWLPQGRFVSAVGRLAKDKGFDILIEAHARVREELPHSLVIVGQGEEQQKLEELIDRLGVSDTVLMPGFLTNPLSVVSRSDALCAPSRHEGWGLMIAEALALGTPVIATDLAGPANVLAGGRYGEMVEPDSVDAFAEALARHLREPEPLRQAATEARNNSHAYSVRAGAAKYLELCDELNRNGRLNQPLLTTSST